MNRTIELISTPTSAGATVTDVAPGNTQMSASRVEFDVPPAGQSTDLLDVTVSGNPVQSSADWRLLGLSVPAGRTAGVQWHHSRYRPSQRKVLGVLRRWHRLSVNI